MLSISERINKANREGLVSLAITNEGKTVVEEFEAQEVIGDSLSIGALRKMLFDIVEKGISLDLLRFYFPRYLSVVIDKAEKKILTDYENKVDLSSDSYDTFLEVPKSLYDQLDYFIRHNYDNELRNIITHPSAGSYHLIQYLLSNDKDLIADIEYFMGKDIVRETLKLHQALQAFADTKSLTKDKYYDGPYSLVLTPDAHIDLFTVTLRLYKYMDAQHIQFEGFSTVKSQLKEIVEKVEETRRELARIYEEESSIITQRAGPLEILNQNKIPLLDAVGKNFVLESSYSVKVLIKSEESDESESRLKTKEIVGREPVKGLRYLNLLDLQRIFYIIPVDETLRSIQSENPYRLKVWPYDLQKYSSELITKIQNKKILKNKVILNFFGTKPSQKIDALLNLEDSTLFFVLHSDIRGNYTAAYFTPERIVELLPRYGLHTQGPAVLEGEKLKLYYPVSDYYPHFANLAGSVLMTDSYLKRIIYVNDAEQQTKGKVDTRRGYGTNFIRSDIKVGTKKERREKLTFTYHKGRERIKLALIIGHKSSFPPIRYFPYDTPYDNDILAELSVNVFVSPTLVDNIKEDFRLYVPYIHFKALSLELPTGIPWYNIYHALYPQNEKPGIKKGKKDVDLTDIYPQIFASHYSRLIIHNDKNQPQIIPIKDVEKYGERAMIFPHDKPEIAILCVDEKFRYPGVAPNPLDNRHRYPYLPACFSTPQGSTTLYQDYLEGIRPISGAGSSTIISTDKVLISGGLGLIPRNQSAIPDNLTLLLNLPKQVTLLRYGVPANGLSILNCILEALTYLRKTLTLDIDLLQLKSVLGTFGPRRFINPLEKLHSLERLFKINIYLVGRDGLLLPDYEKFPLHNPQYVYGMIVYYNLGAESDIIDFPQCELIVQYNEVRRLITSKALSPDQNSDMYKAFLASHPVFISLPTDIKDNKIVYGLYENPFSVSHPRMYLGDVTILSQYIDSNGYGRGVRIGYNDTQLDFEVPPFLPLSNIPNMLSINVNDREALISYIGEPQNRYSLPILDKMYEVYTYPYQDLPRQIKALVDATPLPKESVKPDLISGEQSTITKTIGGDIGVPREGSSYHWSDFFTIPVHTIKQYVEEKGITLTNTLYQKVNGVILLKLLFYIWSSPQHDRKHVIKSMDFIDIDDTVNDIHGLEKLPYELPSNLLTVKQRIDYLEDLKVPFAKDGRIRLSSALKENLINFFYYLANNVIGTVSIYYVPPPQPIYTLQEKYLLTQDQEHVIFYSKEQMETYAASNREHLNSPLFYSDYSLLHDAPLPAYFWDGSTFYYLSTTPKSSDKTTVRHITSPTTKVSRTIYFVNVATV